MSPCLHLGKTTTTEKQNKQITCKIFNILVLIAFELAFYNNNQQKNDFKGKQLITMNIWIEKQTKIFKIYFPVYSDSFSSEVEKYKTEK